MFLYLGFVGHPSNLLHQVVPVPCVTQFRMLTSHAIQYLYLHFCTDFIMLLSNEQIYAQSQQLLPLRTESRKRDKLHVYNYVRPLSLSLC